MGRRMWTAALACILLLTGCGGGRGGRAPAVRSTGFRCGVSGHYRELALAGTLTRGGAGELSLTFAQPATLEGLTLSLAAGTLTLTLEGVAVPLETGELPAGNLGQALSAVLDGAAGMQPGADGVILGQVDGHAYTVRTDAGTLTGLAVPDWRLELYFSGTVNT